MSDTDRCQHSAPLPKKPSLLRALTAMMTVLAAGSVMMLCAGNGITRPPPVDPSWQIRRVQQGLMLYAVDHDGRYPTSDQGLLAAAPYFPDSSVPTDPWGRAFLYHHDPDSQHPALHIVTLGADGAPGGVDEYADTWATTHTD